MTYPASTLGTRVPHEVMDHLGVEETHGRAGIQDIQHIVVYSMTCAHQIDMACLGGHLRAHPAVVSPVIKDHGWLDHLRHAPVRARVRPWLRDRALVFEDETQPLARRVSVAQDVPPGTPVFRRRGPIRGFAERGLHDCGLAQGKPVYLKALFQWEMQGGGWAGEARRPRPCERI